MKDRFFFNLLVGSICVATGSSVTAEVVLIDPTADATALIGTDTLPGGGDLNEGGGSHVTTSATVATDGTLLDVLDWHRETTGAFPIGSGAAWLGSQGASAVSGGFYGLNENGNVGALYYNTGQSAADLAGQDTLTLNLFVIARDGFGTGEVQYEIGLVSAAGVYSTLVSATHDPGLSAFEQTPDLDYSITGSESGTFAVKILSAPGGNRPHVDAISLTAVPEPASLALLALGGVLMTSRRRRAAV